jgi:hypothetical protein
MVKIKLYKSSLNLDILFFHTPSKRELKNGIYGLWVYFSKQKSTPRSNFKHIIIGYSVDIFLLGDTRGENGKDYMTLVIALH